MANKYNDDRKLDDLESADGGEVASTDGKGLDPDAPPTSEQMTDPPAFSESLGPINAPTPVAGEVRGISSEEHRKAHEKNRKDRLGLVPDDESGTRGVNIKPTGHHNPDPVRKPTRTAPGHIEDETEGEYRLHDGSTIPATRIHSPTVPLPPQPAQQPPMPGQPRKK